MTSEPPAPDTPQSDRGNPHPMSIAYRHDIHKAFGQSHVLADEEYDGIPINEHVPLGADADAALLSRPAGSPNETVSNHRSTYRLSVLTGSPPPETDEIVPPLPRFGVDAEHLITPASPERLHAGWLTDTTVTAFPESLYYPYTSLKYHTLLVAALCDNYRAGFGFDDLSLVATTGRPAATTNTVESALDAESVRPHRTVCWTPALTLHVTGEPGDRPSTPLGEFPARSFADVWGRLPEHPIETDDSREARLLDAQLRRIRSWSTALQYIEDTTRGLGPLAEWGESNA